MTDPLARLVTPVPMGAHGGHNWRLDLPDQVGRMIAHMAGAHAAHVNNAETSIRNSGPRFLVSGEGSTMRHLGHRTLGTDVIVTLLKPTHHNRPILSLRIGCADSGIHPALAPPCITPDASEEEIRASEPEAIAAMRRVAAYAAAHMPAALKALHRDRMREGENDTPRLTRERLRLVALLTSAETGIQSMCEGASPFGPMSVRSCLPREGDPNTRVATKARLRAWSMPPILEASIQDAFDVVEFGIGPMRMSAMGSAMEPMELLRELSDLPS